LLDYILPAGISYRIIQYKQLDYGQSTVIKESESISSTQVDTSQLGIYYGEASYEEASMNQGYRIYRNSVNNEPSEEEEI